MVHLRDRSIATSARYERGEHIVDPSGRGPGADTYSVSVVADDLGWADGWSTALFAAGAARLGLLESRRDIEALLIVGDLVTRSAGFPSE